MKRLKFISLGIITAAYVAVAGAYAVEVKSDPVVVAPPADIGNVIPAQSGVSAEKASSDSYQYYPLGKPDPFQPFVDVETAAKKKEEKNLSVYPLERDEIEKFKLAGIVGDKLQRLAIVETITEGKLRFYPLLKGTHIGLHKGKVVDIMADRVIVEEVEKNQTKRIILKLHKENEVRP